MQHQVEAWQRTGVRLARTSEANRFTASPPIPVEQERGRGETAEDHSGPAKKGEMPRLGIDSGKEERAAAGVESREEEEARDEEQVEAVPPASKVEAGESHRVDGQDGGK